MSTLKNSGKQGGTIGAQGQFWSLAIILIVAVAFGGGGSKYGMANLIVQLAALASLSFHRQAFFDFWKSAPLAIRALAGLTLLLPVVQIAPLPAEMWNGLPGRELMVQSLELVGANDWATISVDPIRSLLALTALITPLALLAIGWSAPRDKLILIGWIAVAFGLANFLIGIPQVLSNSEVGVLYPSNPMPGVLFGTFANRNSTGLFLVGALTLAALLPPPPRVGQAALAARIVTCALLIVAIILTRSRTALVLALLPLGLTALQVVYSRSRHGKASVFAGYRRGWLLLVPVVLLVAVLGTLAVTAPGRVGDVAERFSSADEDARIYIWEDGAYAADRYWPVGSGMGTFDDVFQIDESLENMTARRAGRAHNDYLEVVIEAGAPGIALIAGWLALLIWLSWRARTSRDRWIAWSGAIILLTIALQSITDYPLRNQTMLAFGSFALLILARFGSSGPDAAKPEILP